MLLIESIAFKKAFSTFKPNDYSTKSFLTHYPASLRVYVPINLIMQGSWQRLHVEPDTVKLLWDLELLQNNQFNNIPAPDVDRFIVAVHLISLVYLSQTQIMLQTLEMSHWCNRNILHTINSSVTMETWHKCWINTKIINTKEHPSCNAPGHIISDVSWDHRVFDQACVQLPCPRLSSPDPQPPWSNFCCFGGQVD